MLSEDALLVVLWRIIPPTVVRVILIEISRCDNILIPNKFSYLNEALQNKTKQNKHTQKYFAFHRSPIELQIRISTLSGAANKELNPQKHPSPSKMHFHVITDTARAYGSIRALEYYWWRQSHLLVQQCPMHGLLTVKEWYIVSLSWEWIVEHQKAVLLAEGLTSKIR